MNPDCEHINELLVDFADGELAIDDKRLVTDHLASCPECRAELELLERSLHLAGEVWECNVLPQSDKSTRPRRQRALIAAIAASVVLALASTAWWASRSGLQNPLAAQQGDHPPKKWNDDAIERFISRETRSARLAASAQFLASQPGLDDYAAKARQYVTEISTPTQEQP